MGYAKQSKAYKGKPTAKTSKQQRQWETHRLLMDKQVWGKKRKKH